MDLWYVQAETLVCPTNSMFWSVYNGSKNDSEQLLSLGIKILPPVIYLSSLLVCKI